MSEFLTRDEIAELTGKKRPSAQADWLAKNGWVYSINGAQRIIIAREYARCRLGVVSNVPQPIGGMPNFAALQ